MTDLGVYDQATAIFTLRIVDAGRRWRWTAQVPFGEPGDLPVAGDWDANGITDVGVWDPDTATFTPAPGEVAGGCPGGAGDDGAVRVAPLSLRVA